MQTLEEDLQYVLDLLHKLAFASLSPANTQQLRDATECVTYIRDASTLAQEVVWILEDNPQVKHFNVLLTHTGAYLKGVDLLEGAEDANETTQAIKARMSRAMALCVDKEAVVGWTLGGDREALSSHLEARKFDAAAVLSIVAPEWSEQLIRRIDQATSHDTLVHDSRQSLRQQY